MASYCTSDIHGYDDAFFALLQELNLKDDDTLYILGDVIDRGPNGIKLLQAIMDMPNVKMLLGNHEHMMLQYFDPSMIRWIGGRLVLLEDAEAFDGIREILTRKARQGVEVRLMYDDVGSTGRTS